MFGPWLAIRDFISVLSFEDKIGGNLMRQEEIEDFHLELLMLARKNQHRRTVNSVGTINKGLVIKYFQELIEL